MNRNNLFLSLIVLLSMAIGYLFGAKDIVGTKKALSTRSSVKKLDRLISYLSEDYVDKINSDSLVREIIEDIVDELDPHSIYIPAVQKQDLAESMQGNFHGIGVSFFMVEDSIAVVRVLEGGPSQKAGLKSGDRILIANQDTLYQKGFTSTEVVSKLNRKSEIPLKLSVYRKKTDSIYEFNIVRGPVPLPSVSSSYMINEKTGYVKINRFSQTTYEEFSSSLKSLVNQDLENLIIDLRGNPGGYLLPAKQIVDDFLSAGEPIVIVEGNNGSRQKTVASASGLFETGSLYVLVDENSASASEVIAGAIQDNDRGTVIGRRSIGKGLVQEQLKMTDGSAIRLTTQRYYTPSGESIQGKGISP
ncbi:MAG: S41 family peptidase, partial [Flavobacteriaceae bacterium]